MEAQEKQKQELENQADPETVKPDSGELSEQLTEKSAR